MNYNLRVPAAERRKNVATGASPWMECVEVPAPYGRKIPRIHSNLSPLWGWDPGLLFTPGLRPGLHSVAAPRLRPQRETNSRSGSVTPTPGVSRPLLISRPDPDSPPGGGGFPRRLP